MEKTKAGALKAAVISRSTADDYALDGGMGIMGTAHSPT